MPYHWNHLQALSPFPLIRLCILERKTRRPLIRASLPANPAITASEQDAPQRNRAQESTSNTTQTEGNDTGFSPHAVPVESICCMKEASNSESRESVGRFGVARFG